MISYNQPSISREDVNKVVKVLKTKWLTQGSQVKIFENKLKKKFGSKYCSVVSSGTAALHLTGLALGWTKDDIIITTPNTFVATVNSIKYSDAKLDLVDIDKKNYNIDINDLENKLKFYKNKKKRVKAVIAVDYAGHPCNWKELFRLKRKYNFQLVNDNCHALGSKYLNSQKYAAKFADVVTQSFHAVKNITTGEGGAIITNSKIIDSKIVLLRNHGINSNIISNKKLPWFKNMQTLGFNYRLTDIQSALGSSQLNRVDSFIKKRRRLAFNYNKAFSKFKNINIPNEEYGSYHSYHLYPLLIDFKKLKKNKVDFYNYFKKNNIILQTHYVPIYYHSFYKKFKKNKNQNFKNTEYFFKNVFSLPLYPELKENTQKRIIKFVIKFVNDNVK